MSSENNVNSGSKAVIRKRIKAVRNAMDRADVYGDLNLYASVSQNFRNM